MRGMKSEVYAMTNAWKTVNKMISKSFRGTRINYIRNDRHVGDDFEDAVPCERVNKTRD